MRKLSLVLIIMLCFIEIWAQKNPHGKDFKFDCSDCHTTGGWTYSGSTSKFNHNSTKFMLEGQHKYTACTSCHKSLVFSEAKTNCVDCHTDMHNATVGMDCARCHDAKSWLVSNITGIHQQSRFPLLGAHNAADCSSCHSSVSNLEFQPLGIECIDCHRPDYEGTHNPNHVQSGLSLFCAECHTSDFDWKPAKFGVHDGYFPVYSGAHREAWQDCTDCHKQRDNFSVFSCIDCHEHNKSVTDEDHRGINGYFFNNMACFACHPAGTKEGAFDHKSTDFPLTGAHIATECTACHKGTYIGTPTECNACHINNYNAALNPNHTTAGLSTDCKTCHGTSAWAPSSFNHLANSGFDLSEGHSGRQCAQCHKGNTTTASSDCASCHEQNYISAPNHVAQRFPLECVQCHNTKDWKQNTFNHNTTQFPLTGAHIATECTACHKGVYTGIPAECNGCHQADYSKTTNPNHTTLGLSTDCQQCHTTITGWEPAKFPDHQQFFAFKGSHATISDNCVLCHNGNYISTSKSCFGCHSADYTNTKNPVHAVAHFSTECQTCHTETSWIPSTFNHDLQYFPIYSGKHKGQWSNCTDCHIQPANYTVFSCINCHEHSKPEMDDKHAGETGYIYNSVNCFLCHPRGNS